MLICLEKKDQCETEKKLIKLKYMIASQSKLITVSTNVASVSTDEIKIL